MEDQHKRLTQKGIRFEDLIARADFALDNEFYLESSWICYSIIEERLISIFSKIGITLNRRQKMDYCLKKINIMRSDNVLIDKYFSVVLIENLDDWRDRRNKIMHDLAKEEIAFEEFESLAKEGRTLLGSLATQIMKFKKELTKLSIG